jgi:hypothetical protein
VQTSLYHATQGRNAGGNVAVVTKSGENMVHGSAWQFCRNRNQGDSPPTAPDGAALRAVHPHRPSAQPNGFAQRFDQSLTHYFNTRPPSRRPAPTQRHSAIPAAISCADPIHATSIFSAPKFVPVKEAAKMELRTEFFNTFDRVNFAMPNNNVLVSATLGTSTPTAAGPPVIQLPLKLSF